MVKNEGRSFQKVCEIINKYNNNSSKLVPILQEVQEIYRYLPEEIMTIIATSLGISPSRIYGVATFYSHFTLKPKGKYVIKICDGTACHVKKSDNISNAIKQKLGLTEEDNTTKDMMFTFETVSCLGACGLAPVVVINSDVYGQMTPEKIAKIIDEIKEKEVN